MGVLCAGVVFLVVAVVGILCYLSSGHYPAVKAAVAQDYEKVEEAVVVAGTKVADFFQQLHVTDGCQCVTDTCGCCSHIEEAEIHLNATACMNVTYLSEDYGISITATLNKYTIYNETVSAKNPPPICIGAPYVKDLADLCLRLHDIEASRRSFRACAAAEARFKHIRVANYELGCFAMGQPRLMENATQDWVGLGHRAQDGPSVVLVK